MKLVLWLFLQTVTFYLNCLDRVVLAHPFRALATFPVCSSVLSCWTNRAPSMPFSSTFLHSCRGSWLFCKRHPLLSWPCKYVFWCFYYYPYFLYVVLLVLLQEKADTDVLQDSSFVPIRVYQQPQYKCIYTSNINEAEEQFPIPAPCWSHTSAFPQKLVHNIKPTLNGIIVNDEFRFVIFFVTQACVVMMLWWKDNSLVSCWYIWYQCQVIGTTKYRRIIVSVFNWATMLELQAHSSLACQLLSHS